MLRFGYRSEMVRACLVPLLLCTACVWPRAEGPRTGSPVDVAAAGALEAKELARGAPDQTAYGWRLEIVGDRARYLACTATDACTFRPVDVSAESLRATKVVTRARPTRDDGTSAEEVDVYELTLARDISTTRGGVNTDARGVVVR